MSDPFFTTVQGAHMPPFGRIFLVLLWLESILYGVNCVVFGASVYVIFRRAKRNWILGVFALVLFALCTADVIIAFLEVYRPLTSGVIATPGAWDASYRAPDELYLTHFEISNIVIVAQDLLIIWRLYVVWSHNWMVIIVPLVLELAHAVLFQVLAARLVSAPSAGAYSDEIQQLEYPINIIVFFINFTVTIGIAGRLWWFGWQHQVYFGSFTHRASIFTVIESGAIFTATTVINFYLTISGSDIGGILSLYIVIQLASITPLLIIVRVGLGLTHGSQTDQYPSVRLVVARGALPSTTVSGIQITREHEEHRDLESSDTLPSTMVEVKDDAGKPPQDVFPMYVMSRS